MKRCSRCGQEKRISEFSRNKSQKDGFAYYCKVCMRADGKARLERIRHNTDRDERLWNDPNNEDYVERKCMCCRNPFKTANHYRLCPDCRTGNAPRATFGASAFACEAA